MSWLRLLKWILSLTGAALTGTWVLRAREFLYSYLLSKTSRVPIQDPIGTRGVFKDLPIGESRPVAHHTHGSAAADRTAATHVASRIALALGVESYSIQRSAADVRNGYPGSRSYYWAKDVTVRPSLESVDESHLLTMIDVDYYVDMNRFLTDHFNPVFIYTLHPTSAADDGDNDATFNFDAEGRLVTYVAGGAAYRHYIWDYNTDCLRADYRVCGVPIVSTVYLLDKRMTGKHRAFVLLTPCARWVFPFNLLAMCLEGTPLRRFNPVVGSFSRMYVKTRESMMVSTARVNGFACATVDASVDEAISTVQRLQTTNVTLEQIKSYVGKDVAAAAILLDYHRTMGPCPIPMVFPVALGVRRFQYEVLEPDAKPSMEAFMSPLVHEAYAPDQTVGNEQAAVTNRIEKLKTVVEPNDFVNRCMREFVQLVVPQNGVLEPCGFEDVWLQQDRPTQRTLFERGTAMGESVMRRVASFVKREAYGEPKDPRPISTVNAQDKVLYSRYTMAAAAYAKQFAWYAFGKSNHALADRVADICTSAQTVILTDFSRFDGRVGKILRDLERAIMMAAFAPEHRAELLRLLRTQYGLRGVTVRGVRYETGYSRASGSPETSLFNTLANAFVAYMALRRTRRDGVFVGPREAFDSLGVYGGDDGLTADVCPRGYAVAADSVGQKLTADVIQRGDLGVVFLARVYGPYVWYGDPNSCCDIKRQLSKFHVTVRLPDTITPLDKLGEKAAAFLLTDANTPIIGDLCRRAYELGLRPGRAVDVRPWSARDSNPLTQYPNKGEWMRDYVYNHALPTFDSSVFFDWLSGVRDAAQLLAPPLCVPVSVAQTDAHVQDDLPNFGAAPRKQRGRPHRRGRIPA